jgi:hypothetical protein
LDLAESEAPLGAQTVLRKLTCQGGVALPARHAINPRVQKKLTRDQSKFAQVSLDQAR